MPLGVEMNKNAIILLGLCIGINSFAQTITPELLGFESYKLKEAELGEVNYYLSSDSANARKPLLVYLDGSGAFPLFQELDVGTVSYTHLTLPTTPYV